MHPLRSFRLRIFLSLEIQVLGMLSAYGKYMVIISYC